MTTLLVGFDSAWTAANSGALAGALHLGDSAFRDLGTPEIVNYPKAERVILNWQAEHAPGATVVLLDQPTIVTRAVGQRPVEKIVCSLISRRYGGMQPANTSKLQMFSKEAPVWPFLKQFGGPANPLEPVTGNRVFETYPALTIIALGWMRPDLRPAGRLPKYNPQRKTASFSADWRYVSGQVSGAFRDRGLMKVVQWIDGVERKSSPRKSDQDGLDACLCLLVAIQMAERRDCLMVGNQQSGYIVVPNQAALRAELDTRCREIGWPTSKWVREFRSNFTC